MRDTQNFDWEVALGLLAAITTAACMWAGIITVALRLFR